MSFLKRLFSPTPSVNRARGLMLYIKPKACREIIAVRIDTMNDLSRNDDDNGFFVRKLARGNRCPFQVEIELTLDGSYRIIDKVITNGEEVTEADYLAFVEDQKNKTNG